MITLRKELEFNKFDWKNGRILYQETTGYSAGWSSGDDLIETREIDTEHKILDKEFNDGYGSPEMPRFVAYDKGFIYFPSQYDGSTRIVKVAKEPEYYIGNNEETPYPGQ